MKSALLSALTITSLLTVSYGQDFVIPSAGGLAQQPAPLLDTAGTVLDHPDDGTIPSAVTQDAPPSTDETAPLRVEQVPPVLDAPKPADEVPVMVPGQMVEKKWKFIPFGRFRVTADDNLFISATARKSDVYFSISPGIALGWGDYSKEVRGLGEFEHYFESPEIKSDEERQSFIFIKYAPNASVFTKNTSENDVDHDASVAGRFEMSRLILGFRMHFQTLSGADIDAGGRVRRKIYGGEVTSQYELTPKTSVELNVYSDNYDYDTQLDWRQFIVEDWLNYQLMPKTQVAVGTRFGTTDIQNADLQTFEQLVGRVVYSAGSKLAFSLDGGVEWRQFGGDGGDSLFTVFSFGATYQPFDGTLIAANAFRRNSASVSAADENIISTGFSARVRQRFFQRVYFSLEGGYSNAQYEANGSGPDPGREDDTLYIKPSLSYDVTKYLSAESSYQYQKNKSSFETNSFRDNLFTFQLNLQF